jgi:hypothetical protein
MIIDEFCNNLKFELPKLKGQFFGDGEKRVCLFKN